MPNLLSSQRGISIIAAVFTLIILGIFGAAIVTLVSTEHEIRVGQLSEDWAFYNAQAGFEFAIKEIVDGGYPIVTDKPFGKGAFTVQVNYVEGSDREIIVSGKVSGIQKTHQIDHTPFGGDCLNVNTAGASMVGNDLTGITLQKTCNNALTIDKMMLSWNPDGGEHVTQIRIGGVDVWSDVAGEGSGSTIDITDTRLDTSGTYSINFIRFSALMSGKQLTIVCIMTDTSTKTVTFTIP